MSKFAITGGRRLKGELCPQGAKNEALQVICACLLTKEEVTLSNVPEILDVLKLIELLQGAYRSDTLHMENLSSRLRISTLIISKRKIFIIKRSV